MTDPRIETLIDAIQAEGLSFKHAIHGDDDQAIAARILAVVDAAAWRTIESAPEEETIIVCGGSVSQPTTASWSGLPGNPWWSYSQENYSEGIDAPTHWQPLPSPPVVDVGGDDE